MTVKNHATVVQRLAARLIRQRLFSVTQTGALVNMTPSVILALCRSLTPDALQARTLAELGAPDDVRLYDALLAAANRYIDQQLARVQPGEPRGQKSALCVGMMP